MNPPDKNIFSIEARKRLVELGWSVTDLAKKISHPRESVSASIHRGKFPRIRRKVARKLNLSHLLTLTA
jgi:ribosome-binding protein aMBF1 (putative translation factor)